MLENHINSHQKSELKRALKKLNRVLVRSKRPNAGRSKYNLIKNTERRIAVLKRLVGIPKPKPDAASSDGFNSDAVSPDAINTNAVNPYAMSPGAVKPVDARSDAVNADAVNPDPVNSDAVKPDAVKPDAVNSDAVSQDWTNPALESIH